MIRVRTLVMMAEERSVGQLRLAGPCVRRYPARLGARRGLEAALVDTSCRFGITDTVSPLREVRLHRPVESFRGHAHADWGYPSERDRTIALREHDEFVGLLTAEGVRVHVDEAAIGIDACFACDAAVMTPWGAVLGRPGKRLRRAEIAVAHDVLEGIGVPIIGAIEAAGTLEGGDVIWLSSTRVLVGVGARTNHAGVDQFEDLLGGHGTHVRRVELPWCEGPEHCLHLRSLVNLLRGDLAVVNRPWLPVALLQDLEAWGIETHDAIEAEVVTQGGNLLVLRPGRVAMVAGNPRTRALLEGLGVTVLTFSGQELCIKGTGGPTCLAMDLARAELLVDQ
jgi:N-dimethylarginine dimethylaminohydrolase